MSTLQIKQRAIFEKLTKKQQCLEPKKGSKPKKGCYAPNITPIYYKKSFQLIGLLTGLLQLRKKQTKESISFISSAASVFRLQGLLKTPSFILKPSSTVAGFKKAMYNSVKYSQNQLQPGYNRRKFNYSHYNQTIKENTRLSKLYAYLSTAQLENYRAFTGLNKDMLFSTKLKYLNNNYNQGKTLNNPLPTLWMSSCCPVVVVAKRPQQQETRQQVDSSNKLQEDNHKYNKISNIKASKTKGFFVTHSAEYTVQRLSRHIKSPRTISKLVNFLESRLDVILWRSLFSKSIDSSRQRLREGISVNGGIKKKASFITLPADVITFNE